MVFPFGVQTLSPPAPSFRELTGGEQPVPLAVLHGGLQDFPRWITPMVVSCDEQQSFIRDAVLRVMPSGASLWERDGEEVSLPCTRSVFLPSASMVANCVGTLTAHSPAGLVASYGANDVLVSWPSCVGSQQPWLHYRSLLTDVENDFYMQAKESGVYPESEVRQPQVKQRRRKRKSAEGNLDITAKSRRIDRKDKCADEVSRNEGELPPRKPDVEDTVVQSKPDLSWKVHTGSANLIFLAPKSKPGPGGSVGSDPPDPATTFEVPSSSRHGDADHEASSRRQRSRTSPSRSIERRSIRHRKTGGDGPVQDQRQPRSPTASPLPHQRAAISKGRSKQGQPDAGCAGPRIFPADWQCPTVECVNHTKMVFAKRDKCPVCGASRPSTPGTSRTERMRGSVYRRYEPAPARNSGHVSHHRDNRSARDYMERSVGALFTDVPQTSVTVGLKTPAETLQANQDYAAHAGASEVPVFVKAAGTHGVFGKGTDEVEDMDSYCDMMCDTNGLSVAAGLDGESRSFGGFVDTLGDSVIAVGDAPNSQVFPADQVNLTPGVQTPVGVIFDGSSSHTLGVEPSNVGFLHRISHAESDVFWSTQSTLHQLLHLAGEDGSSAGKADFADLEAGIWRSASDGPSGDFPAYLGNDPISQFSGTGHAPVSQVEDRSVVLDPHAGTHEDVIGSFQVSPTVGFSVDPDVYIPLSFEQCVHLLLAGPPVEEVKAVISHPGFSPFWFVLGQSALIDEAHVTRTSQGIDVICAQGRWPDQCVWCLQPFDVCQGCALPDFVPAVRPSMSLPQELRFVEGIFDSWAVSTSVGMERDQSFVFTLVAEFKVQMCWCATVGPHDILLVFDAKWMNWLRLEAQQTLVVFDSKFCGVFEGKSVFFVAEEGHSFLCRQWSMDSARFLELFAGIGGWSAALPFLVNKASVVSVEIDPVRAGILARSRKCPVIPLDLLMPDMVLDDIVVLGDIRDKRWMKITLAWPFRGILHSPPCTSFSGGGSSLGLQVEDGQLMLHALGIVSVLRPQFSVGENVKGLLKHPHWQLVHLFARCLGLGNLKVKLLDLDLVMPMKRPRCFFCFFEVPTDFSLLGATKLALPGGLWQIDESFAVGVGKEQEYLLSCWDLLPAQLKRICPQQPERVLDARTYSKAPLPVLMSAYMHQHLLPWASLCAKGLNTWLVQFGSVRRYLHPWEAARLLGFGPDFEVSSDLDLSMSALGNAVSPVQVVQILRPLLQDLGLLDVFPEVPTRLIVALIVCGWPFLHSFAIRSFRDSMKLVKTDFGVRHQDGQILMVCGVQMWWVSGNGLFDDGADVSLLLSQTIGVGKRVKICKCLLHEDIVEVWLEIEGVKIGGIDFSYYAPPFVAWGQILATLDADLMDSQFATVHLGMPAWMLAPHKACVPICLGFASDEVIIFAGQEKRSAFWQEGQSIAFFLRQVFPFPVAAKVSSVRDMRSDTWIGCSDPLNPGVYQVDFDLSSVFIHPLGRIQVCTMATVGEVQIYLAERFYGGQVQPIITVGGRSVSGDTLVLAANCAGVLRVRVFPLRGGAFSLAALEEKLGELLIEHGVGEKDPQAASCNGL